MQLKYGSYSHDSNAAAIAISKDVVMGEGGIPQSIRERWDVTGEVSGANESAVKTAINALVDAYSVHGKDLALYHSGGTISAHAMLSSETIWGTKVVKMPSFPKGDGSEYVTSRSFSLAVEGEYPAGYSSILSFRESLSWQGNGGPIWNYIVPLAGPPIHQVLTESSVVTITQEGYAVGDLAYPSPQWPIWPEQELGAQRRIRYEVPSINSRERRVSWSYTFLAPAMLSATPHYYQV